MHAVAVRVSLSDADTAQSELEEKVVPRVSGAPGFVAAYWTRSDDKSNGQSMMVFESEDAARDVFLYINSPGGSVSAGLAIYDTMQYVNCDVATVTMGLAASMGQFLLSAGAPGKRFALPHARILMHQPSGGVRSAVRACEPGREGSASSPSPSTWPPVISATFSSSGRFTRPVAASCGTLWTKPAETMSDPLRARTR